MAFCHCFNNGLPRSIGHGRLRLTNRQASSLGVIDLFSVCVKEHLTDCGIIVIHVLEESLLGEPLLGHGLLIELDVRLCDEVVLELITCWGGGLVSRPHLLAEVHRGSYHLTSVKLKGRRNCWRIMKNERRKMKVMKRSRKSERTLTSWMTMWMRRTLRHLEPCDVCEMSVTTQNKEYEDYNNYAHIHVFMLCFVLMFLWILVFVVIGVGRLNV